MRFKVIDLITFNVMAEKETLEEALSVLRFYFKNNSRYYVADMLLDKVKYN